MFQPESLDILVKLIETVQASPIRERCTLFGVSFNSSSFV